MKQSGSLMTAEYSFYILATSFVCLPLFVCSWLTMIFIKKHKFNLNLLYFCPTSWEKFHGRVLNTPKCFFFFFLNWSGSLTVLVTKVSIQKKKTWFPLIFHFLIFKAIILIYFSKIKIFKDMSWTRSPRRKKSSQKPTFKTKPVGFVNCKQRDSEPSSQQVDMFTSYLFRSADRAGDKHLFSCSLYLRSLAWNSLEASVVIMAPCVLQQRYRRTLEAIYLQREVPGTDDIPKGHSNEGFKWKGHLKVKD